MYLQVVLWVPVRVKDDTGVGSCEVNSEPTCSCAQQEDESIRVGFTEAVYCCLTKVPTYTPVYPLVEVSEKGQFDIKITNQWILLRTGKRKEYSLAWMRVRIILFLNL